MTIFRLIAVMALFSAPSYAAVHQHGVGTLQVLQAGKDWQFVLQLPAFDVLGFEHTPQTEAQLSAVAASRNTFDDFHALFTLDKKCSVVETVVEVPTIFTAAATHEHEHEHEHEEHSHENDKHEDFRAAYLLKCANGINKATFNGFAIWQALHTVNAHWVTMNQQSAVKLSGNQAVIRF
jgi:hypothetical protein